MGKFIPKFPSGFPIWAALAAVVLLWLASGIFIVNPGEEGVVLRFGKFQRTAKAGPHYHLPFPVESRQVLNTERLRTIVIGRSSEASAVPTRGGVEESNMFTGDENIVHLQFSVQYVIEDVYKYLFNVRPPEAGTRVNDPIVVMASEAAMREVVGGRNIDAIFTAQREGIQVQAQEALQAILDNYRSGVRIRAVQILDAAAPTEVRDAFADFASAREDKARIINQAEAYRNEVVPVASGTAASIINQAEAYRQQTVLAAEGEATRFLALVTEYNKAKDITQKRMYFEAMQEALSSPDLEKIFVPKETGKGMLPLLQLNNGARALTVPVPGAQGGAK